MTQETVEVVAFQGGVVRRDVIDTIDELEAEHKCPHCQRQWHALALTRQMAAMIDSDHIDPNYFAREDTSEIVCEGSDFIGPRRPPYQQSSDYMFHYVGTFKSPTVSPPWTITYQSGYAYQGQFAPSGPSFLEKMMKSFEGLAEAFADLTVKVNLWLPGDPEPELSCKPSPEIEIEFGPQNWAVSSAKSAEVSPNAAAMVSELVSEFTKPDIAQPTKPPMDFSHLNTQPYWITNEKGKKP